MLNGNGFGREEAKKTHWSGDAQSRAWFLSCFSTILLPVEEDMILSF